MTGTKVDLSALARHDRRSAPLTTTPPPPSIPLPGWRWKTRLLLPGLILALPAALLALAARETLQPAMEVHLAPVVLKQVDGGDPPASSESVTVLAPGWVEADPFVINVPALAGGVVREVLALEGDRVAAGQVVARLIDNDATLQLASARARLQQAQAELDAAQAQLHAAEQEWEHPIQLQRDIRTGEATIAETRAELAMLEPQIRTETARARELREDYQRLQQLRESKALADGDLIRAQQRLLAQEGIVEAAEARRGILEAKLARQQAELDAARQRLDLRIDERRNLDMARASVARAQADLAHARTAKEQAQLQLARMEILAPADGIVLSRMIEPGTRLMTTDDMAASIAMRLYDPKRLQVRVDVPLADAMRISVGDEAQIITEAMPDRTFRGRVSRIVHEANIQKNTVEVKVAVLPSSSPPSPLSGEGPSLKPEMLTRVRFMGEQSTGARNPEGGQALFIPRAALNAIEGNRADVWIIDESQRTAALRQVRFSHGDHDWVRIREGLHPGDRVILDAPHNLRSGIRIRATVDAGVGGAAWR